MTTGSYGVTWHEEGGGLVDGRIRFEPTALVFDGRDEADRPVHRQIDFHEITGIQVQEATDERTADSTLVLRSQAGEIAIRSAATRSGVLQELASGLAALSLGRLRRAVIVVPLREGAAGDVRELLRTGPPFDPAEVPLLRHEVLLTPAEAVFVFEAPSGEALESIVNHLDVWAAAATWRDLIAGPPRIAEVAYSWQQPERLVAGLGF